MNTTELIKAIDREDNPSNNCLECTYGTHNGDVIEKLHHLAELENKLENGTLVELPRKVGDTVYYLYYLNRAEPTVCHMIVAGIKAEITAKKKLRWYIYDETGCGVCWDYCFTDKAQAEVKLKELEEKSK